MLQIRPLQPDQWRVFKEIRLAALADAPYAFTTQLATVQRRPDWEWETIVKRRAADPAGITFLAYWDEKPCAMAACVLTDAGAELLAVWVNPEHRGRKVGAALVEYACNWAVEKGVQTMIVGVFADNTGAINFYEGVGFLNGGEMRNDPRQPHRPILILSMELTGRLTTS